MKYLIDNNLPPKLAHAIRELCFYDKSIEVHALADKFKPCTKEDRFKKGDAEKEALRRSGLTVFFLAKQWSQEQYSSIGNRAEPENFHPTLEKTRSSS